MHQADFESDVGYIKITAFALFSVRRATMLTPNRARTPRSDQ
jgi:hypothetical protein